MGPQKSVGQKSWPRNQISASRRQNKVLRGEKERGQTAVKNEHTLKRSQGLVGEKTVEVPEDRTRTPKMGGVIAEEM